MRATRPASFQVLRQSVPPSWLAGSSGSSELRVAFAAAPQPADPVDERAREIEAMIAAARANAEAEGRAHGEAEGRTRWDGLVVELSAAVAEIVGARGRLLAGLEDLILELTLTVARVLLERELAEDPALVARLVREAVALIGDGEAVEIRVAPALHEQLADELEAIRREAPRASAIQIRPDPTVEAGCLVETPLARVDATLATRLRTLLETLRLAPEEVGE
jgi:flagellar biosynthesis/type III secretory pathway protein FliH